MTHNFKLHHLLLTLLITLSAVTTHSSQQTSELDKIHITYRQLAATPGDKRTQPTSQVLNKSGTRFYKKETVDTMVQGLYAIIAKLTDDIIEKNRAVEQKNQAFTDMERKYQMQAHGRLMQHQRDINDLAQRYKQDTDDMAQQYQNKLRHAQATQRPKPTRDSSTMTYIESSQIQREYNNLKNEYQDLCDWINRQYQNAPQIQTLPSKRSGKLCWKLREKSHVIY